MKQTIILATDSQEPSGLGEHMLTLGSALAAEYDVVLAAPDHDAGKALLRRAAWQGLRIKTLDLAQPKRVRDWLAGQRGAVLHVHAGIGWEGHDLVRFGKAAGLGVVRTEHLPYLLTSPVQRAAYRAMLANLDGRIAVSKAVSDSHQDSGGEAQVIVQNGITPRAPSIEPEQVRAALGIASDAPLVLMVARLAPQKGHSVLIDAAPQVLKRHPKAMFVLVGSGPDQEQIAQRIQDAGLSNHFLLLGHRDDVPDLLSAADLFVLPSLFEGLSLALLEAMAAKVPAVVTPIGGLTEALGPDHAFLAQPNDAPALAEAIIKALTDKPLAAASSHHAHQRFAERFSADRMAAETGAVYQSILHKQGTKGSYL